MEIIKNQNGGELELKLSGRIDTTTAPQLEGELGNVIDEVEALTFDFAEIEYISSAGLRVLLAAQKKMNKRGSMVVKNVNDVVMEVFEITGFVDILTIE